MQGKVALFGFLAVPGTVLPLSQFVPWGMEHGLDIGLFFGELFSTRIGGFFGWDVIVAAIVLIVFIQLEGKRQQMRSLWVPVLCTLSVGVSCGLPVFLAMREYQLGSGEPGLQ